jgi:hypothetical protein
MKFDPYGEAAVFFQFLGKYSRWFFLDAQFRNLSGERGGLVGKMFGSCFAHFHKKIVFDAQNFHARLISDGRKFDMITRESPARDGARSLLIDDLNPDQLDDLYRWWSGPFVVIETSPSNFQALLISPRPLQKNEVNQAQKSLAHKFGGDSNSTKSGQFHRLPGSLNHKPEALINKLPFCTRLTQIVDGEVPANEQLDELLSSSFGGPINIDPDPKKLPEKSKFSTGDNSDRAFGWAVNQIKNGTSDESILSGLVEKYLAHHDPKDWPERTLWNAHFKLGLREKKFQSGLKKTR